MRCSWWLSTSFLQCLRVWSGQSIGPQSVSAMCAGHYVGRWRRAQGALWWHTLRLSSAGRPACDAVLACLRWAEDDRCSRMTARVLLAVSDSAPVDQSGKVAGAVRAALDEMHAAQYERGFLLKFNRWPASMQAPLTCQTYRHPKHTFTQIFTMFRWLTNAVPTGRRRRRWMCRPLRLLHCECCGAKSNVVPLSRLGEMGVCHDHLAELASDHFDGSSWRAYVHLVGRVAPDLVETWGRTVCHIRYLTLAMMVDLCRTVSRPLPRLARLAALATTVWSIDSSLAQCSALLGRSPLAMRRWPGQDACRRQLRC